MAFIPLQPFPVQYQDASSDNDSGAVISFFLAGTSTPANLFSDDIGTAIGTSITLNSRGFPESGGNVITLYRDVDVAYKLVITPTTGSPITVDPIPKLSDVISQALIAGALYPNNAAENTLGTSVDARNIPWFTAGRYGLSVSASSSDNEANLKDLVEVAITSERNEVKIEEGRYAIDSTDLTSIASYKGQILIKGVGRPNRRDIDNDTDFGTILDFQNTTGNSFILGDGDTSIRQVELRDLGVLGNTTGNVLHMDYCPQSAFQNVSVHNDAAGIAWFARNIDASKFSDVLVHGNNLAPVGEGFVYQTDATNVPGGMILFDNMVCRFFDTACRLGKAYDAAAKISRSLFFDSCEFSNCQGGGSNEAGLYLRHGVTGVFVRHSFFEKNDGANVKMTDSVDRVFIRDNHLDSPTTISGVDIELGATGGTATTDSVGRVEIINNDFSLANRPMIRRYTTSTNSNGTLFIDGNKFSDDSGDPVVLDDTVSVDVKLVIGQFNDFGTRGSDQIVRNITDDTDLIYLARFQGSDRVINVNSVSLDYSLQTEIPTVVMAAASGGNVNITLPTIVPIGKQMMVIAEDANFLFQVIIDPGATSEINGKALGATISLKSDFDACLIIGRNATGWDLVRLRRGKGAHIADIGAAPTQLQFNTLLAELRVAGSLDEF